MSESARVVRDEDFNKIKLWFFRDLNDDQRLKLFGLLGWPVEEMPTHGAQDFALRSVLGRTPTVKAAPEVKRTHHG